MKNNYIKMAMNLLFLLIAGNVNATSVPDAVIYNIPGNLIVNNICEYDGCRIQEYPLLDYARSDGYILFKVVPGTTGEYAFTANIATGTGNPRYVTLGPVDAEGNFISDTYRKEIYPGNHSSDWTQNQNDYIWRYDLEGKNTYTFKLAYEKNGESYGINLYSISAMVRADSDYTVTYYKEAYTTPDADYSIFVEQPYNEGQTIIIPANYPGAPEGMMFSHWQKADGTQVNSGDAAGNYSIYPVWTESILFIQGESTNLGIEFIKKWSSCSSKGTQIIDSSRNGAYILFSAKVKESGRYTFTSNIGTKEDNIGCILGYIGEDSEYIVSEQKDITNTGSWTSTIDYKWIFELEADVVYNFKMTCIAGSGYALNAYTLKVTPYETVNIDIEGVNVNGFSAEMTEGQYTSSVYHNSDAIIEISHNSFAGTISYTAMCGDKSLPISADGIISKEYLNKGDIVDVRATVSVSEATKDIEIRLYVTDTHKVRIKGGNSNDGFWTQTGASSLVCSWTDHTFWLTPSDDTGRLSNGYWTPANKPTTYGFCMNNASVRFDAPGNYQITSVTIYGDAAATIGLSSEYATVSSPTICTLPTGTGADNLGTLTFKLEDHIAGKPLTINVSGRQCNLYFIIEYRIVDDETAPSVKSQNIEDNSVIINRNGSISLMFSEPISFTEQFSALFDGEAVTPVIEDEIYVNYYFHGLNYNTDHKFVIAPHSIKDNSGNALTDEINLKFSIGDKPVVVKKTFDFIIGIDGTADEAFAAANASKGNERFIIFVPDGTYRMEGNSGDKKTDLNRSYVSVVGQSKENSILCNQPESYGISTTATVHINNQSNVYMQDITLRNLNGDPKGGKGMQIALYDRGQKNTFKNVKLDSYQDTYVSGHRAYFETCEIRGGVDYICGGGDVFFSECLLYNNGEKGNKITAPATNASHKWGYVFMNCTVDGGEYVLGRPWQGEPRANFINTRMNRQPSGNGYEGMGNLVTHFYEYNSMDFDGNVLPLDARGNSPTSINSYVPVLTNEQAEKFTLENVLGGKDGWVPSDITVQMTKPVITISKNIVRWETGQDALCTVIFKNNKYYACTTADEIELTEEDVYTICFANEMGGLGEVATVEIKTTDIENVVTDNDNATEIYYDILGRRLKSEPSKGFFIRNGKKIVR